MKVLTSGILMILLAFAAGLYLPWWSVAIATFAVSVFIRLKPPVAWLTGFLAVFLLWFLLTLLISSANQHILAQRMSVLILGSENPVLLTLVTALIGGVVAGLAALSGSLLASLFIKTNGAEQTPAEV